MPTKTQAKVGSATSGRISVWNQLYFVLATLLGLLFLIIGVSTLVNTALTMTWLKVREPRYNPPPQPYYDNTSFKDNKNITDEQRQTLNQWEAEYKQWQTEQKDFNYEEENRKRSLAWSIALILTGGPVFALHAPVVFKRARE